MFVQTGDSVTLDIKNKTLPPFKRFVWINNKSENVVRFLIESGLKPHSLYKDRVYLNTETFSLTMKNMQKTDSGLYTAKATGQQEMTVVEHNVSVIGDYWTIFLSFGCYDIFRSVSQRESAL